MKSEPIKRQEKTPDTATVISLQQKIERLQIQIKNLKVKLLKAETKNLKQEQKISRLQIETDKLRIEKPGIEEILRQIAAKRESK